MDQHEIVIKLKDIRSVPEVYINGERVNYLNTVSFDWQTQDAYDMGYCGYEVIHFNAEEPSRITIAKDIGEKK